MKISKLTKIARENVGRRVRITFKDTDRRPVKGEIDWVSGGGEDRYL